VIADGAVEELARRKRERGKSISITGSATLIRSLLAEGLVDELRLSSSPSCSAPGGASSTTGRRRCR
jgi:dihydrofolate reductase